jgi:hypothetical protein
MLSTQGSVVSTILVLLLEISDGLDGHGTFPGGKTGLQGLHFLSRELVGNGANFFRVLGCNPTRAGLA